MGAASEITTPWHRRLKRWVRGKEAKPFKRPRLRDHKAVLDRLDDILTDTRKAQLVKPIGKNDPLVGVEYLDTLLNARTFLRDAYPTEELSSVMGPQKLEPSQLSASRWLAQVAVVEDPDRLIDDIEMNGLEAAQVTAFKVCYPELYVEIYMMLAGPNGELAKMRAEATKRGVEAKLPFDREATIRVLGESGFVSMELPEEPKPAPPKGKAAYWDASKEQAPADKLLRPL
jgi:hypothetical protein